MCSSSAIHAFPHSRIPARASSRPQANMTQERVDAICKDIRAMDCAKRHLTQSISVLENFGTLTDALTELKESSSDRCASRGPC
jgi:Vps53-like, N-terminal